jgi:hypothetical protein
MLNPKFLAVGMELKASFAKFLKFTPSTMEFKR